VDKSIAEAMFASAAGVLSTLVDRTVSAGPVAAGETEASIRIVPDVVATLTTIPAAHFCFVTRYEKDDLTRVVELMLGTPAEGGELDAMQLSIVSETVAQISSAMAERLTQDLHVPAEGIHTDLVTDAGAFPAPPFDSFVASLDIGTDFSARMTIDFDGVARSKIEPKPAASTRRVAPPPESQPVTYTPMTPTPIRAAAPGQANLDLVHDIPLEISAVLGQTALSLRDVVALQTGSVFELDKLATDPIDLYVNNILIARGEVVVVDDKFAVKISELNPAVDKV
jgi:flagellar motor switch protein FliN